MKRSVLLAHITAHGCVLVREGGSHSIWKNPGSGEIQAIPRHREIKKFTAKSICRKLGIIPPAGS